MLDVTFTFDGKRMRDMGLELQEPLSLSAPVPRGSTTKIPGRNGDLHYFDGSYENRELSGDGYILGADVINRIGEINALFLASPGYKRIELDEDPLHFMLGKAKSGISTRVRKGLLSACPISFDVKPQRFLKYGEEAIFIDKPDTVVHNPTAFPALPLITFDVYPDGEGKVLGFFGDCNIGFDDVEGRIVFDAETLCAYDGEGNNINGKMFFSGDPSLMPGETNFFFVGASLTVIPRWWEL